MQPSLGVGSVADFSHPQKILALTMSLHPQSIGPPFVFDEGKDLANQIKHGISLKLADFAEWDAAQSWPDGRRDYGEPRWASFVPIGGRLHVAIVVPRRHTLRIVSLRKANNREVQRYEQSR